MLVAHTRNGAREHTHQDGSDDKDAFCHNPHEYDTVYNTTSQVGSLAGEGGGFVGQPWGGCMTAHDCWAGCRVKNQCVCKFTILTQPIHLY